jgi:hypothetical protein
MSYLPNDRLRFGRVGDDRTSPGAKDGLRDRATAYFAVRTGSGGLVRMMPGATVVASFARPEVTGMPAAAGNLL